MQRTQVVVVDDLDGQPITDGEEIHLAVNGKSYVLDLSVQHAEEFHAAVRPYVEAGRRVSAPLPPSIAARQQQQKKKRAGLDPAQRQAIRLWAEENGHPVSQRGRMAQSLLDAYEAAHSVDALSGAV